MVLAADGWEFFKCESKLLVSTHLPLNIRTKSSVYILRQKQKKSSYAVNLFPEKRMKISLKDIYFSITYNQLSPSICIPNVAS